MLMVRDVYHFTRRLTFHKLLNLILVQLSYTLSVMLGKPVVWGRPWFVSIEPASVCNLSCPQCPAGQGDVARKREFMDPGAYRDLLGKLSPTALVLSLYFQGEPLLHKEFTTFARLAVEKKVYTQTSTNGQLLTERVCREIVEAGLDRIIVSLDGTDQESYRTYRGGGDIRKVKDGIRTLVRMRREAGSGRPFIIVQFLVFKFNFNRISDAKKMALELGADRVWIKFAQVEYPETADRWIPDEPGYSRYEKNARGNWKRKGNLRNRCRRLWQTAVITSDGLSVPCCFDKRASYVLGDTEETDIRRIWKGLAYRNFRKKILSNRAEMANCTNCTEGAGRIYL